MTEFIESLVGKTLNLPKEKLAEILYEADGTTLKPDAVDKLAEIDAQRIKAIKDSHKDELTRMHDDGYSKGKGESLTKWEKQLKEELGLQTDAKGIDLVKEAISKAAKVEIDEEKVKLHPKYMELERRLNSEYLPKAEYDKVKAEFDKFRAEIDTAKVNAVIQSDAIKIFRSLKPVLSKDPVKATNQEQDFVNKLTSFEYELNQNGDHVIKVNGKRLETANGFPVTFADFVKSEASKYYDFQQQDPKGQPGNGGEPGGGEYTFTMPKNEKEYQQALASEADPKKAYALMIAWQKANQ